MSKKLIERWDPARQLRSAVLRDDDGTLRLRETQDVTEILDQNGRDASNYDRARERRAPGGFRHIARIPIVVMAQLRAAGVVEGLRVVDEARFMQFLNDPDVRKLRTDNGRPV